MSADETESKYYPTLGDIAQPLPAEELQILVRQYQKEQPDASVQTKFNLAWGLVKSDAADDQKRGLELLAGIYNDTPSRRRECLYYLAIGSFKLGDYTAARKYADILLQYEPTNRQIIGLRQEIEDRLNHEGLVGMAIVGGAAALVGAGAAILGAVLSKRRR